MLLSALLLTWSAVGHAAEPHFSYPRMVSTNGYGALVFTEDAAEGRARLDVFSDHLYQKPSPTAEDTRDLLYDAYFGVRTDEGGAGWLHTAGGTYAPLPGTNILRIDRSRVADAGTLSLTEYAFAPLELPWPGFVHLLQVQNTSGLTLPAVTVFSLHNFHLGAETIPQDASTRYGQERLWSPPEGGIIEQGDTTGLIMHHIPLVGTPAVGCTDLYTTVLSGGDLPGACDTAGDDRVGGMQWSLGPILPGESAWIGVVSAFASNYSTSDAPAAVALWRDGRDPQTLLADEQAAWAAWLAAAALPEGASADEQAVYIQALVALKMGQVREPGAPYGQLVASLPASAPVGDFQHIWNITWVRDAAYAIQALSAAGFHEEARAALAFQIQEGCCGAYAGFLPVADYALSVCRYYGDGTEWSDDDGTGPNIELDNFGLFLWALGGYIAASQDDAFLSAHADRIFAGIADVLVESIDPEWDLIIADSSIWERHWYGREKHFTYTSAWAVRGLREAAILAERLGDTPRASIYRDAADQIAGGIAAHLVRDDLLAGNLEELQGGGSFLDAAAVDAFNNGTLPAKGAVALTSLEAWETWLGVASGPGLSRNDDGDLYDRQEWVMVDLRVAEAWRRACQPERATVLEDWITDHAVLNHLILPELLDPETADYAGPTPMMGFGSGMYVLHLLQRPSLGDDCGETDSGALDSGPSPTPGGDSSVGPQDTDAVPSARSGAGCGCGVASAAPLRRLGGGAALLLLLWGAAARRRRDGISVTGSP